MDRFIPSTRKVLRLGRWCFALAAIGCCGLLSGCQGLDLRQDAALGSEGPAKRSQGLGLLENEGDFFGVSNKAREIEQNCMR